MKSGSRGVSGSIQHFLWTREETANGFIRELLSEMDVKGFCSCVFRNLHCIMLAGIRDEEIFVTHAYTLVVDIDIALTRQVGENRQRSHDIVTDRLGRAGIQDNIWPSLVLKRNPAYALAVHKPGVRLGFEPLQIRKFMQNHRTETGGGAVWFWELNYL